MKKKKSSPFLVGMLFGAVVLALFTLFFSSTLDMYQQKENIRESFNEKCNSYESTQLYDGKCLVFYNNKIIGYCEPVANNKDAWLCYDEVVE